MVKQSKPYPSNTYLLNTDPRFAGRPNRLQAALHCTYQQFQDSDRLREHYHDDYDQYLDAAEAAIKAETLEAVEAEQKQLISRAAVYYQNILGQPATPYVREQLRQLVEPSALNGGGNFTVTLDHIIYALEETANAPRPSMRYFMAIMRRMISDCVPQTEVMYHSRF